MGLDHVRSEIEHIRAQVGKQRKEILQLQRAGISTASAELLLGRMHAKIDDLCAQRRTAQEQSRAAQRRARAWRPGWWCAAGPLAEGYCYQHVQAITVAIDQYAEKALGNRDYFLNKPYGVG